MILYLRKYFLSQVNALKEYYEENDGSGQQMLRYYQEKLFRDEDLYFSTILSQDFPFSRVAVMVGQWGVPGVVIVFATIYWIMGISKYISG